ncbi:CoA-binding protein [Acidiphilium sp. AL]|uniref:succinate--CoA ligase subunit alpha n=1 Tax=Acidiphilium sp. AL TaxID=2871704 RepID=UPI0021CB34AF|nr:CoA-binding protein [Acidiphilium sp. AL]MCU4160395.1 CoA-binding protein [Acidiphilium sp. AL]
MSGFPIIRRSDRILVLGMTGGQGTFWSERMKEAGTRIVAGVNPKRAGTTHLNLPVFATAKEAVAKMAVDVAVMFVPPALAGTAALDVIDAGISGLVMLTEHIPSHDMLTVFARAKAAGTCIVGPNTAGLVTPGEAFVGIMPGHNANVFKPGCVGVISRSGSLGTLICLNLTRAGLGQSSFVGIGGDPMIGTTTLDALKALDGDERTEAVVMVGEIGGGMEEEAAIYAATMQKPVVSFIAGRAAPPGRRMGHAGAIVAGNAGSYAGKRAALEAAGVTVADTPRGIVEAIAARLTPQTRHRLEPSPTS